MSDRSEDDGVPTNQPTHDVTLLLVKWRRGDDRALDQLVSLVYDELRRLAGRYLNHESAGLTLQTHDLIHEAFLRMIGQRHVDWQNRAHFFGIAAQMMRRILTDHARRRSYGKHGGGLRRVALDDAPDIAATSDADIVAVDEALTELKDVDEELARIVELRSGVRSSPCWLPTTRRRSSWRGPSRPRRPRRSHRLPSPGGGSATTGWRPSSAKGA